MIKIHYCNTVTKHINGNPILGYGSGNISKRTKATATYSWLFLCFKIETVDKMRTKGRTGREKGMLRVGGKEDRREREDRREGKAEERGRDKKVKRK